MMHTHQRGLACIHHERVKSNPHATAAAYLIQHGPATEQERWEEDSGYSPFLWTGGNRWEGRNYELCINRKQHVEKAA